MIEILKLVLKDKLNRKVLIKEFQELIWNNEDANDIFVELAYDLDFYEPDEILQKEDPSYYGDEELEKKIRYILELCIK